jgi:hypothetical protein
MQATDSRIKAFQELRKEKYGYLERLQLWRSLPARESDAFCVEMDLRAAEFEASRLLLSFEGVAVFRMRDLQGTVFYLIEIESIADRQLEGLNFQVHEIEHHTFSCQRSTFAASIEVLPD